NMETTPLESEISPEHGEEVVAPEPATFETLVVNPDLKSAIARLGFTAPTPVQALTLPVALAGKDLIVQAKTGSGKTLAYALPMLVRALDVESKPRQPHALVVVPTRELAIQVQDVINSLTSTLKPVLIIGGSDFDRQVEGLDRDSRVVIGTPGRL